MFYEPIIPGLVPAFILKEKKKKRRLICLVKLLLSKHIA